MKQPTTNLIWRGIFAVPLLSATAFLATSCSPETPPADETSSLSQDTPATETQPIAATTEEGAATDAAQAPNPGKTAPDFTLTDTNGNSHSLADYRGKYVVLEWLNHGCPFVKKHYGGNNMQRLQNDAKANDVVWLSIVSSAPGTQGHYAPEEHNKMAAEKGGAAAAILLDEAGEVGRLYKAKVTPHMFVIDPQGTVLYNGAIDDQPSADLASLEGAKNYVEAALTEARAGKEVTTTVTQPYGCDVKYKS